MAQLAVAQVTPEFVEVITLGKPAAPMFAVGAVVQAPLFEFSTNCSWMEAPDCGRSTIAYAG